MRYNEYLIQYDCIEGNEDKLWYIASRYSSLMEIDKKSGEIIEIYDIPSELQYRTFVKDNDCFFLFPSGKGKLIEYSITSKETKIHEIPNLVFERGTNWSARHIRIGDNVYLSWANPVIVRFNIVTKEWKKIDSWLNLIENDKEYTIWFKNAPFRYKDDVFFHIGTSECFVKIDKCERCEIVKLSLPEYVIRLDNVSYHNSRLWIQGINDDGTVCIFVCEDWQNFICHKICEFSLEIKELKANIFCFYVAQVIGDKLLLLPGIYDRAFLISLDGRIDDVSESFPLVSRDRLRDDWISAYNYVVGKEIFGHYIIIHSHSSQIVDIDIVSGEKVVSALKPPKRFIAKLFNKEFLDSGYMMYENNWDIRDMIYGIENS